MRGFLWEMLKNIIPAIRIRWGQLGSHKWIAIVLFPFFLACGYLFAGMYLVDKPTTAVTFELQQESDCDLVTTPCFMIANTLRVKIGFEPNIGIYAVAATPMQLVVLNIDGTPVVLQQADTTGNRWGYPRHSAIGITHIQVAMLRTSAEFFGGLIISPQ